MTHTPPLRKRSGAAGMLLLFSVAFGGVGLAFDVTGEFERFWLGAEPGARALIGAVAAGLVVAAAHLLRLLLARRG
ncbi:MAG: hypothetical protein AB7P07_09615 [Hyphomonadaceae bacterium]